MTREGGEEGRHPGLLEFLRGFIPFWRSPEHKWLKVAVYVGFILHVSFIISLKTGWWNAFFHHTGHFKVFQASDFFALYLAGHDLIHGGTIYSTTVDNPDFIEVVPYFFPFRYLPSAAYIGVALNAFNPWTAYWLWVVFYEILFFASILWLGYHFGTMRHLHVAAALYLFFTTLYPEIYVGQFNFLQSVFILGMLITAEGGWHSRTGGWWVASVLWKINTAICLPALLRWHLWKPLLWLVLLIIITCGPYFLFHPDDAAKFFFTNFRYPGQTDTEGLGIDFPFAGLTAPGNSSFQGLITKVISPIRPGEERATSHVFNVITIAWFLIVSIWVTIRVKKNRLPECLCLWTTLYFLVYTDVWDHHYVILMPVLAFIYLKRPCVIPWLIWLLLIIPSRHMGFHNYFLMHWDVSFIKPICALLLYAYCIFLTMKRPEAGDTTARTLLISDAGNKD